MSVSAEEEKRLVVLFCDDDSRATETKTFLEGFGYQVFRSAAADGVAGGVFMLKPVALLVDVEQPEAIGKNLETLQRLKNDGRLKAPVAFIGNGSDFTLRLKTVRVDCAAFLERPASPMKIVDTIDVLTRNHDADPYRVLVVDDQKSISDHFAAILRNAGFAVKTLSNAMKITQYLDRFAPELILLDLHMPDCDGQELAALIRQNPAFNGVPIVFLSSESDVERQITAMGSGADDFLTKNIDPEHLVKRTRIRASRFRALQDMIKKDGLTGLFNHTTTKEQLAVDVAEANASGTPLSLAMIDIDHFKKVNDTHGHLVGDLVIKSLAGHLKLNMPERTHVGRVGGEEFAVIMPGVSAKGTASIMDGVREKYAQTVHRTPDNVEFSVTLSCGVAELKKGMPPTDFNDLADKALYEAKHGGRNRVVIAGE